MTVATNSYAQKKIIQGFASKTGADLEKDATDFKLHDFGYRGCSSQESAAIGSMAHLTSFKGTDTLAAIKAARKYYGPADIMPGLSIPATEHRYVVDIKYSNCKVQM